MVTARASADLPAAPEEVFRIVADPSRLPAWDVTFAEATPVHTESGHEPTFTASRVVAGRKMQLVCRVLDAEPPTHFAFECSGDAAEHVREDFELAPGREGAGSRLTRESDFSLGNVDPTSVIPQLTYTRAWMDRGVEQAFAHLSAMLDESGESSETGARRGADAARKRQT